MEGFGGEFVSSPKIKVNVGYNEVSDNEIIFSDTKSEMVNKNAVNKSESGRNGTLPHGSNELNGSSMTAFTESRPSMMTTDKILSGATERPPEHDHILSMRE